MHDSTRLDSARLSSARLGAARRGAAVTAVVFGCTDAAVAASRVNERAAVRGNTAHAPAHFTPPLIDRCPFGPFALLSFLHPRPSSLPSSSRPRPFSPSLSLSLSHTPRSSPFSNSFLPLSLFSASVLFHHCRHHRHVPYKKGHRNRYLIKILRVTVKI